MIVCLIWQLAHTARAYPGFHSIKPTTSIATPTGWDASLYSLVTPQYFVAGTHLYSWAERDTMRVKCPAQEHSVMTLASPQTWTAQSGVQRDNH